VHNLVHGLMQMRRIWHTPALRKNLSTDAVINRCMSAPDTVLREATACGKTAIGDVRPGTLLVLRLNHARERLPGSEMEFMTGTWSRCPAAAFVPALLQAVWEQVCALDGTGRVGDE
jgi:hypothetical protein